MKIQVVCFSLLWPVATDAFYPTLLALSQGQLESLPHDRPDYSSGGATVMQPPSESSAQDSRAQTAAGKEKNPGAFPTLMKSTQSSIDDLKTRHFGGPSAAAAGNYLDSLSAKSLYVERDTLLVPQRGANAGGYLDALNAAAAAGSAVSAGAGSVDAKTGELITPRRHANSGGYLDALSAASVSQGSSSGGFHGSGSYLEVISAPSSPTTTTDTELSNDDDLNEPEGVGFDTEDTASTEHSVTVIISETPVTSSSDAEDTRSNDIESSSASTIAPGTSYMDMLQSKTRSSAVIASGGGGGMSVGNAYLARLSGISTSELKPSGDVVVGNKYIESLSKTSAKDDSLMQKIKNKCLSALGFFTVSTPFCLFAYKELTGHWPDITDLLM